MIIYKALLYLSVLLAWESTSYQAGFKLGSSNRYGSQYSLLMLKSDSNVVLLDDVNGYLDALRFPSERLQALKVLTSASAEKFSLTAGDCKMIMAAAIEIRSEEILVDSLKLFKSIGFYDSELMYVGVRIACKKKVWNMAYSMLLDAERNGLVSDTDAVNSVIQLLTRFGKIKEAWNVLELAHNRKFGPDADCDISSYFMVISCAGRADSEVMVKAFKMMEKNYKVEIDENLFLVALNTCSLAGDFTAAAEIFTVYERLYGVVQTRAYCLLLMSYVSSRAPIIGVKTPKLDAVVTFLVRSNIDSALTIANLIFQFFSIRNDVSRAAVYLDRMNSLNHRPSTNALLTYADLVLNLKDGPRAVLLHRFMALTDFIPPPKLVQLCLESLSDVTVAENAAQIFRNALLHSQETNSKHFLSVIQLCVKERKLTALSVLTQNWIDAVRCGDVWVESSEVIVILEQLIQNIPLNQMSLLLPGLLEIFLDMTEEQHNQPRHKPLRGTSEKMIETAKEKEAAKDGEKEEVKDRERAIENSSVVSMSSEESWANTSSTSLSVSGGISHPTFQNDSEPRMNEKNIPESTQDPSFSPDVSTPTLDTAKHNAWRSYRFDSYQRIVESCLGRGGSEVCLCSAISLLRRLVNTEHYSLNQAQIRKILSTAIQYDHGNVVSVFVPLGGEKQKQNGFYNVGGDSVRSDNSVSSGEGDIEGILLSPSSSPSPTRSSSYQSQVKRIPSSTATASTTNSGAGVGLSIGIGAGVSAGLSAVAGIGAVSDGVYESESNRPALTGYGNCVRLFLFLRNLKKDFIDDVAYRMTINSLIKRRRRIEAREKPPLSTITRGNGEVVGKVSVSIEEEVERGSDLDLRSLDLILCALREDTVKASISTQKEVLFFYFSRGDFSKASTYFKQIEKEAEEEGGIVDAALAEVYLSHMLQIGDSSEALETLSRLERKHSTHSNRSLLLDSTPGKGTGSGLDFTNGFGSKLKVGALLYAKVVSVLVRANRIQEAEDLKKVLEAKNLTLGASHVHLFLSQELRMGCAQAAVDAFGEFFSNTDTVCPDSRAVAVLALALKRLNNTQTSAHYATQLYPHIDELGPQLRPPVYGLFARFAMEGGSLEEACGYLSKVPYQDRRQEALCELAKLCVVQRRPDLMTSLLDGSPVLSPELLSHTVASFAMTGLHVPALSYEAVLTHEMSVQNRTVPWGFTFLLLSAAQLGQGDVTRRIMQDMAVTWQITPTELDFNLAVFAHLKGGITSSGGDTSAFTDLFGLLYRMKSLEYGLHPVLRGVNPVDPLIPLGLRDLLGGVKMAMSLLSTSLSPSSVSRTYSVTEDVHAPIDLNRTPLDDIVRQSTSPTSSSRNVLSQLGYSAVSNDGVSLSDANRLRDGVRSGGEEKKYARQIGDQYAKSSDHNAEIVNKNVALQNLIQDPNQIPNAVPGATHGEEVSRASEEKAKHRVWTPTNLTNVNTEFIEIVNRKSAKKSVMWPLRSNFMSSLEDSSEDSDQNNLEDNDDVSVSELEREGGEESGGYFDDSDRTVTNFLAAFSPAELSDMNIMDSLVLLPLPFTQGQIFNGTLSSDDGSVVGDGMPPVTVDVNAADSDGTASNRIEPEKLPVGSGTYRSRRKGGRAGARSMGKDSGSSPNLEALLSRSTFNAYNFLGNPPTEKTDDLDANKSSPPEVVGTGPVAGPGTGGKGGSVQGQGQGMGMGQGQISSQSQGALSEAAKRANLMHNMRRVERLELLTNKRKDR